MTAPTPHDPTLVPALQHHVASLRHALRATTLSADVRAALAAQLREREEALRLLTRGEPRDD